MRVLVLAVLLFLSTGVFAVESRVEPVAPSSHSFVKLHTWGVAPSGCVPRHVSVTRDGNVIDVTMTIDDGCSGIAVPTPWTNTAALGVLEPGVYEVHISADYEPPSHETLVITDAAPPFRISAATVSVDGGDTITLWAEELDQCSMPADVTIDGLPATVVESECSYVTVVTPEHAAGAVDVSAKFGDETLTTRAALRYVDPASAPDDSAFERLLVPLLYDGPGAYGSQWATEGTIRPTESSLPLRWMHDVVNAECASGACSGEVVELASFGNHPAGLLLFVPRDLGHVDAKSFVRDISREDASWGTQVPVVREKDFVRDRTMVFPNVPFDAPYRTLLRVYGVDGAASHVRIAAGTRSHTITLTGACGFFATPCNSARPAFAAIDLLQLFPELSGRGRFTVAVSPHFATSLRYWAFVSITNNETQYATVMTP